MRLQHKHTVVAQWSLDLSCIGEEILLNMTLRGNLYLAANGFASIILL